MNKTLAETLVDSWSAFADDAWQVGAAEQSEEAERARLVYLVTEAIRDHSATWKDTTEVAREIVALREALEMAINTVECASVDLRTGEFLPWYKTAKKALGQKLPPHVQYQKLPSPSRMCPKCGGMLHHTRLKGYQCSRCS